jgi:glycosyltransferase involved in cell wall biosynthesis
MTITIQDPGTDKKPILSFCISTYNRSVKIFNLVLEILEHNGNDIEVVVIDNLSTDDTKAILSVIKDKRFHFYENSHNIGGLRSGLKGMTKCQGNYILNCCDKDYIYHQYIYKLVNFLSNNMDVAVGYCSLNSSEDIEPIILAQGIEALKGVAYLSKHPTGNFFKNEYLTTLNILDRFSDIRKFGGFALEFISAELCILGKAAIVNIPLCGTESKEEAKNSKSHTFSGKVGDAFFFPDRRYDLFIDYVMHISSLKISKLNKREIIKKVFHKELVNATIGFKEICKDPDICSHYDMNTRKVGFIELFKIDLMFSGKFINKNSFNVRTYRLLLCLQVHIDILINMILIFRSKVALKIKR